MPPLASYGKNWRDIAHEAQNHRDQTSDAVYPNLARYNAESLPLDVTRTVVQSLTNEEQVLTEKSSEELIDQLGRGELTSVAVVTAFLRRAAVAQTLANCITELLPKRALERAKQLDKYFSEHGKTIGPLHGLPISVKEHINMKGLDINGGYCSGWQTIAEHDAHLLKILSDAGAVFFARTTQPQTFMHLETSSNLYGTTVNPFNRTLSSGGSSGGEGALLALRGSCLGVGSDIGGSIRSPAANNGLFGLRPTAYRIPSGSMLIPPVGDEGIIGVYGPLSTTLAGIDLFMRTVLAASPWLAEPSLIPLPWRESTSFLPPRLKVAIVWDDGVVKPHPPITRALRSTAEKLRTAPDIELVDWTPLKHDYAWRLIQSIYFPDGGDGDKTEMARSGEPVLPLSRFILTENPYVKHLSIPELWDLVAEREAYRTEYAKHWNESGRETDDVGNPRGAVDVILCPVGPGAAPIHETARYWGYTSQWNLLDYPALVVPTGMKVDVEKDVKQDGYEPRNADDTYNWELYEPERYVNAPLSLQIVGRRFDDEKVMQAAERLGRYCHWKAA